tara:strand:+ start:50 stop:379 length:330 start_codon:yes stop_codon:yes gene_type:complete
MFNLGQLHIQISIEQYEVDRRRSIDELPDYTTYSLGFTDHTQGVETLEQLNEKIEELCTMYRETSEADITTPLHVGVWFTTPNDDDVIFEPWNDSPNPNWTPTLIEGGK